MLTHSIGACCAPSGANAGHSHLQLLLQLLVGRFKFREEVLQAPKHCACGRAKGTSRSDLLTKSWLGAAWNSTLHTGFGRACVGAHAVRMCTPPCSGTKRRSSPKLWERLAGAWSCMLHNLLLLMIKTLTSTKAHRLSRCDPGTCILSYRCCVAWLLCWAAWEAS